ncbi:MAG: hypothetical protein AAF363_08930 [Bacteroidota bacterium]
MATLKLKVSDKILDKVLWLLGQFKSEDLEIIESEESFDKTKKYLESELERIESGSAKNFSIDEVDRILEKTIKEYES